MLTSAQTLRLSHRKLPAMLSKFTSTTMRRSRPGIFSSASMPGTTGPSWPRQKPMLPQPALLSSTLMPRSAFRKR